MQAAKQQSDTAHDSVYEELASSKENMLALERDLVQKLEEARANYDAVTDQLRNVREGGGGGGRRSSVIGAWGCDFSWLETLLLVFAERASLI